MSGTFPATTNSLSDRCDQRPDYPYMISQTIGTMLFEKIPVRELFDKPNLNVSSDDGQLELFRDLKS